MTENEKVKLDQFAIAALVPLSTGKVIVHQSTVAVAKKAHSNSIVIGHVDLIDLAYSFADEMIKKSKNK